MLSPWFGEFMGTLVLILMGDGVVAGVLLKKSKAENSGWIVITTGWAMAVISGVFTPIASGSSGGAMNPPVTLGLAGRSGDVSNLVSFFLPQLRGVTLCAPFVWLRLP